MSTRGWANQTAGCRTFQTSRLKKSLDVEIIKGNSNDFNSIVKKLSTLKIKEETSVEQQSSSIGPSVE